MRTDQHQHTVHSKQRLRNEIDNQIEAFLDNGGRIDVVAELSAVAGHQRSNHWPAAAELALIPNLLGD